MNKEKFTRADKNNTDMKDEGFSYLLPKSGSRSYSKTAFFYLFCKTCFLIKFFIRLPKEFDFLEVRAFSV